MKLIKSKKTKAKQNALTLKNYYDNKDRILKQQKERYYSNIDRTKSNSKARRTNDVNNLTDRYIKQLITKDSDLQFEDIPQEMVDSKRQYMNLKRVIHGKHPNSLKTLQKYQWKKGKSGNPSGRPVEFSKEEQEKKEKKRHNKRYKTLSKSLDDKYIKSLLCSNNTLKHKDIPKEMVKAKKLHMKINRIIKEKNDAKN